MAPPAVESPHSLWHITSLHISTQHQTPPPSTYATAADSTIDGDMAASLYTRVVLSKEEPRLFSPLEGGCISAASPSSTLLPPPPWRKAERKSLPFVLRPPFLSPAAIAA